MALSSKEAGAKQMRIQQLEKDIATITSHMQALEGKYFTSNIDNVESDLSKTKNLR